MKDLIVHIAEKRILNPAAVRRFFEELPDGAHRIKAENRNKRSLNQNDYYHKIVCELVKDGLRDAGWGWIKDRYDAHEWLKARFLQQNILNEKTGEVITRVRSTTELTTVEFNQYLEAIWQFASEELGIYIPSPNEQAKMNL